MPSSHYDNTTKKRISLNNDLFGRHESTPDYHDTAFSQYHWSASSANVRVTWGNIGATSTQWSDDWGDKQVQKQVKKLKNTQNSN